MADIPISPDDPDAWPDPADDPEEEPELDSDGMGDG
jgi:hypothetical protein